MVLKCNPWIEKIVQFPSPVKITTSSYKNLEIFLDDLWLLQKEMPFPHNDKHELNALREVSENQICDHDTEKNTDLFFLGASYDQMGINEGISNSNPNCIKYKWFYAETVEEGRNRIFKWANVDE